MIYALGVQKAPCALAVPACVRFIKILTSLKHTMPFFRRSVLCSAGDACVNRRPCLYRFYVSFTLGGDSFGAYVNRA